MVSRAHGHRGDLKPFDDRRAVLLPVCGRNKTTTYGGYYYTSNCYTNNFCYGETNLLPPTTADRDDLQHPASDIKQQL